MKIMLINFQRKEENLLTNEGFEAHNIATLWNGGTSDINPTIETKIVFLNGFFQDQESSSLHSGNYKKFQEYVNNGGVVVTFMENAQQFHLLNLIGLPQQISVERREGHQRTIKAKESKFLQI